MIIRTFGAIVGLFLAAVCYCQPSVAEYYSYVVGGNLSSHAGDPPTRGFFDYWAVYYFHKGVSTTNPTFRWGMDISNTASGVTREVTRAQKFEKTYEKWCDCSWGPNTYFNPLYPVAVINAASRSLDLTLTFADTVVDSKFHEIADNISEILDRVNQAADLAGQRRIVPEWKGPLSDFFEAIARSVLAPSGGSRSYGEPSLTQSGQCTRLPKK